MSVLTDCDDLNEWSLFGGQLELVSLDTSNLAVADSWLDNTLDNPEMAHCTVNMDDLGITSSLKVWNCATDDHQLVEYSKENESAWCSSDDAIPERSSDGPHLISDLGSLQKSNIRQTRLSFPIVIKPAVEDASAATIAAPCFMIDSNFADESFINCVVDADVEVQGEFLEEYVEIELPDTLVSHAVCDDGHVNLVANDGESLSSYDDEHEPALSTSSACDVDDLGFSVWDLTTSHELSKSVERRLRKKEQNKTAALRYRLKKRIERGSIQSEYDKLLQRNIELKTKVEQMAREMAYLRELIDEMSS